MIVNSCRFLFSALLISAFISGCKPAPSPETQDAAAADEIKTEAAPQAMRTLRGEIWYRERIILPDDINVEIYLEDTAKMDVAATVIASTILDNPGIPPWPFELEYDENQLQETGRYTLRVRVMEGERLRFINMQLTPAFSEDGKPVRVMVQAVAAPEPMPEDNENNGTESEPLGAAVVGKDASKLSNLPLNSSQWLLVAMAGNKTTIRVSEGQSNLTIDEGEQRIGGNSGCNLFNGSYQVDGDKLSLGGLISTRMACPENIMNMEQKYLDTLQKVRYYQRDEQQLLLLDENKNELLRYEEKPQAADNSE